MSPPQDGSASADVQAWGRRAPRRRACLLKGCERVFSPRHPLCRYCSWACRRAARRWSLWRAGRRYRATEGGRCRRRDQSRRYRQQAAERRQEAAVASAREAGQKRSEGHQCLDFSKKCSCDRPGCYERFDIPRRSPLKRFCSYLCRCALRRVLEREARWRDRYRRWGPLGLMVEGPTP